MKIATDNTIDIQLTDRALVIKIRFDLKKQRDNFLKQVCEQTMLLAVSSVRKDQRKGYHYIEFTIPIFKD